MALGKGTPRLCQLTTPFEGDGNRGWEKEHPRPQLRRESWLSLCGHWQLSVLRDDGETPVGPVQVPFPPESRLSGVQRTLAPGERWRYCRAFSLPDGFDRGRVLLHFGAVDQIARVWVNGQPAGGHTGGYLPFTLDITPLLTGGENRLTVEVTDELDTELPYGKQRRDRGGMWYTPVSGIWQPVWLEHVPEGYIRSLRLTPTLDSITIETEGGRPDKTAVIATPHGELRRSWRGDRVTIPIEAPRLWSPEDPYLYAFTLTDGVDALRSYFALRTVTIETVAGQSYICLNGAPYFFHGLLDQGYWSDGIYLPASPEGYSWDVGAAKALGFNLLRKHIKLEPEQFYYDCDRLGMIVFQDMVNSGPYHYLVDTALPTVAPFARRGISHAASPRRREQFEGDCRATINHLYNHPCVCGYTIFNEGWGQYDADRIYRGLKELDPGRVWDATSGWFAGRESDVYSEHCYFRKFVPAVRPHRPLVLSEFGGYSCKVEGHAFNLDKTYGYKAFADADALTRGLEQLYREEVLPAIGQGLCAAVLTQLSDVEDEVNGLVTYDRQVVKPHRETMARLGAELQGALQKRAGI